MSNICSKCGTQFDSACCPNCGTPSQPQTQQYQSNQLPPIIPPPYQQNLGQSFPKQKKKRVGCLTTILIVIGLIIIIGIIGSVTNNKKPTKVTDNDNSTTGTTSNNEVTSTQVPEKTTFSIGETVELNDILVTLIGVTESSGSDFNKPSDGNVFALCEFEIENASDKDITVSSIMSFEAYCDDYSIQQSISALLEKGEKNQLDGSVAAGKKMNGIIAYEIPSGWKELEINFTPVFWSGKDITFKATK